MGEIVPLFPMHDGEMVIPFQPFQRHDPPSVHHSQTSTDASHAIKPKTGGLRKQVLELLQRHPEGLIDEDIALMLNMNPSTARPRRLELQAMKLIEARGTAPTVSGRQAQLWFARERGDCE